MAGDWRCHRQYLGDGLPRELGCAIATYQQPRDFLLIIVDESIGWVVDRKEWRVTFKLRGPSWNRSLADMPHLFFWNCVLGASQDSRGYLLGDEYELAGGNVWGTSRI